MGNNPVFQELVQLAQLAWLDSINIFLDSSTFRGSIPVTINSLSHIIQKKKKGLSHPPCV